MSSRIEWFPRFGNIPGISYIRPQSVDASRLPGFGAVPELQVYDFDGKRLESLLWSYEGITTSASPAQAHEGSGDDSAGLLEACYEGLELPGGSSDYHFLIQGTASQLWKRRRQEPDTLEHVERLCWLDVELVEACPQAITNEYSHEPTFYQVETFGLLINLYEREGFLREALDVAERAARSGQGFDVRDQLAARVAAVDSETSGYPGE